MNSLLKAWMTASAATLITKAAPTWKALQGRPHELIAWVQSLDDDEWNALPPFIQAEYYLWKSILAVSENKPMPPIEVKTGVLPWQKTRTFQTPQPPQSKAK